MKDTINFITEGADVKRYHTVRTLAEETVGHHSHGVAMFCLLLKPEASRSLIMAALFHDLAEHKTGDIPSPAKREFDLGNKLAVLESMLMENVGIIMPNLSCEDSRVLKLADSLQGLHFSLRDAFLGNVKMYTVADRYISYINELKPTPSELEVFESVIQSANPDYAEVLGL